MSRGVVLVLRRQGHGNTRVTQYYRTSRLEVVEEVLSIWGRELVVARHCCLYFLSSSELDLYYSLFLVTTLE